MPDVQDHDASNSPSPRRDARPALVTLALTFLKIGAIGFGGWMAMIALIEQEYVRRRRWIEAGEFLHGVGLSQLIGSFSVNTAMFIGYRLCGAAGLFVAFVSFLAPSVALILGLSWVYFTYHTIPSLQGALAGIEPVVIALVFQAAISIARSAIKSWTALVLAIVSFVLNVMYVNPVLILLGAGLLGIALKMRETAGDRGQVTGDRLRGKADGERGNGRGGEGERGREGDKEGEGIGGGNAVLPVAALSGKLKPLALAGVASAPAGVLAAPVSLRLLFWTFLKIGCVFFGGGFVLVPLMHHYMVDKLHWLNMREFSDGVAMSQITPGPIAILSTFSGYKMAGVLGGLVATMGLYIPSIVLMLFVSRYYKRLRHMYTVQDFLGGVVPAVAGLVAAAVITLAPSNIHWHKPIGIVVAVIAVWLFQRKWHPAYVLAIGAVAGILFPHWFM